MPEELRQPYRRRLDDVEDPLLEAVYQVAEFMPRVTRALWVGDPTLEQGARSLCDDVDRACRGAESRCFQLLVLQTPVAGDLRMFVALLRLVAHVERACALLCHAASSTRHLSAGDLPAPLEALLRDLAIRSSDVFRAGLDGWRTRDGAALEEVVHSHESVDALQVELLQQARDLAPSNGALAGLGLLARTYERIADHGVAFARDVTFVMTGERLVTRARVRERLP